MPKLLYLVTEDWYFTSHRLPMARAALAAGFEVVVVTNISDKKAQIEAEGMRVIPFSLSRGSLNPLPALSQIKRLTALYKKEQPDIVHHVGMKPVLYGSLAAGRAKIKAVINAFAGLGYLFTGQDAKARTLRGFLIPIFRHLFRRPGCHILLQNDDDRRLLEQSGIARPDQIHIIRGSGVDVAHFMPQPYPDLATEEEGRPGSFICVFAGRMIAIKGLATLQEAFKILETKAPHIQLWLCGKPDAANPGLWTLSRLERWANEASNVSYKGFCNMKEAWAQAHLALQPSWGGEGVPKSLLVAASCARPIVATDVPGCRDVVEEGRNGYLVPPRNAEALAAAIEKMAGDFARSKNMGLESRQIVTEKGFSATSVASQIADLYRGCLASE